MEIVRYLNGVTVSEKELRQVKTVTQEMTEAVNEVRRRAEESSSSNAVVTERADG